LPAIRVINSSLTMEADQPQIFGPQVMINPNPASGYIIVSFVPLKAGASKIEIFTINGRKVFESYYGICEAENKYIKQVDVNKLINGIYLVRVSTAGKMTNKKIIISR
jgi:Secretion system C-terminal sorting domain